MARPTLRRERRPSSRLYRRRSARVGELLTEFAVPDDVKIYPKGGHGFMDDHAPEAQTLFLRFLARISGTRNDEAATVAARRRIVGFFNTQLIPDAPSSS